MLDRPWSEGSSDAALKKGAYGYVESAKVRTAFLECLGALGRPRHTICKILMNPTQPHAESLHFTIPTTRHLAVSPPPPLAYRLTTVARHRIQSEGEIFNGKAHVGGRAR